MNEDTTRVVLTSPDLVTSGAGGLTYLWPPTTPLPIVGDTIRMPPTSPTRGDRLVTGRRWEIEYDDRQHRARPVLVLTLSGDDVS